MGTTTGKALMSDDYDFNITISETVRDGLLKKAIPLNLWRKSDDGSLSVNFVAPKTIREVDERIKDALLVSMDSQ